MNEFEKLDALYQRDQGIGVPYPETDTNIGYKPPSDIQINASTHYLGTDIHEFEIKLDGMAER